MICPHCKKEFVCKRKDQRHCSSLCSGTTWHKRKLEKRRDVKTNSKTEQVGRSESILYGGEQGIPICNNRAQLHRQTSFNCVERESRERSCDRGISRPVRGLPIESANESDWMDYESQFEVESPESASERID